jgi:iron transport multicopper oxidase
MPTSAQTIKTRTVELSTTYLTSRRRQVPQAYHSTNLTFQVPTLYTALTAPSNLVNNPAIYGVNANPYILPYGAIVELTVINYDDGDHPFHLHSHNFQVISRSGPGPDDGSVLPVSTAPPPEVPMRRDTLLIMGGGNAVIRFQANNPGVALFHCHIEWHVEAGLTMTFIEAPTQLQAQNLEIPDNHRRSCEALGIPMKGNAAGNDENWLDLTGANTEPPLNTWG